MSFVQYSGRKYKKINITISPKANFGQILRQIDCIEISEKITSNFESGRYALLELLNNSIRAHRKKEETRNILVELIPSEKGLSISVKDWGGGFDVSILPYDLSADISEIDTNGEPFQCYREENGYQRFGMGIYVAKKVFPSLQVKFFDSNDSIVDWVDDGSVTGTIIVMKMGEVDEPV